MAKKLRAKTEKLLSAYIWQSESEYDMNQRWKPSTEKCLQHRTERQCMYKRNIVVHLCNHCCCGRTICISNSECLSVALWYPACNAHALYLPSVACLVPPYFSKLSQKLHNLPKNTTEHKMRVLIFFCNFCLKHFLF